MIGDDQPDPAAGVTLEALACAYYVLRDSGAEVVLASPGGGSPGVARTAHPSGTAAARFLADGPAREDLAETLRYDQVCLGDFDAVLGFHGDAQLAGRALVAGVPVALVGETRPVVAGGTRPVARSRAAGLLILGITDADAARAARALLGAAGPPAAEPPTSPR